MESGLSAIGALLCLDLSTKKPSIAFSGSQGQLSRFDAPSPDQLIEGSKISAARVPIVVKLHKPEIQKRPEKAEKAAEETPDQRKKRLNKPYTAVFTESHAAMSKVTASIVLGGNSRSGKSSLLGHLLQALGQVSSQQIYRFKRDSQALDKRGMEYAWVVDTYENERYRGCTLYAGTSEITLENKLITLFDAPGRSDLVPEFIYAANHADGLLLVVDAKEKTFLHMFEAEVPDQTKEHSFISRGLGMTQVVVAVNKMDKCGWRESQFTLVSEKVGMYLRSIGFKDIVFIPISALQSANLTEVDAKVCPWYSGPCLMEAIVRMQASPREPLKPIRFTVDDFLTLRHGSQLGEVISGKLEGGVLSLRTKLFIVPSLVLCSVKQIMSGGENMDKITAGWCADVTITGIDGIKAKLASGDVACGETQTVSLARKLRINGITFDLQRPLMRKQDVMVYVHSAKVAGKVTSVLSVREGQTAKQRPRLVQKYKIATIEVETEREIPIEKSSNFKTLGRVVILSEGRTILCGSIAELLA